MEHDSHSLGMVNLKLRNVAVEAEELKPFVKTKTCLRDWPTDARYFSVPKDRDLVVFKNGVFTMNGYPIECSFVE